MRAHALVGIVATLHVAAFGTLVMIQGCSTTQSALSAGSPDVAPPPKPALPPVKHRIAKLPATTFKPATVQKNSPAPSIATHAIQKGETLSHVASSYGVNSRDLAEYNNIVDPNRVRIGQEIKIPSYARKAPGSPAPRALADLPGQIGGKSVPSAASLAGGQYSVQRGDTLSHIARRYGIKVSAIKQANGMSTDVIRVGQKLAIPGASGGVISSVDVAMADTSKPVVPVSSSSTVDDLDTNVDVGDLYDAESRAMTPSIQDIDFPADSANVKSASDTGSPAQQDPASSSSQEKPIIYKVMDGDTIDEVAKLFIVSKRELVELNGLAPGEELAAGRKIKIPPSAL